MSSESRPGGRITIKVNSLVDSQMINALYEASQAGAAISLIVRGICGLRPGVQGMSDGITVRSIVGRYLEHSRIYRFGDPANEADWFVGSADVMPRNLDRRVEALFPVQSRALQRRIDEILDINLADDQLAWELHADGNWSRVAPSTGVNAQERLQQLALARSQRSA